MDGTAREGLPGSGVPVRGAAISPAPLDERWLLSAILLLFALFFFVLPNLGFFLPTISEQLANPEANVPLRWRENFAVYFVSITLEAAPYMILGAFLSGLIETVIPSEWLPRMARRLGWLGIPAMVLAAPLFPICECGVVVVARRLMRKGLPLAHTIAYLIAAPIVNPVVLTGTWLAFYQDPTYPLFRGLGGVFVALILGAAFFGRSATSVLRDPEAGRTADGQSAPQTPLAGTIPSGRTIPIVAASGGQAGLAVPSPDHHGHDHAAPRGFGARLQELLGHVRNDFLEMGIYFLFGVFLASCLKTFVGWEWLDALGGGDISGPAAGMVGAFVMSLCSEADAFVAASFTEFDLYAQMAFLVLGPMLDIKLILMYRTLFNGRFIAGFSLLIILCVSLYIHLLHWVPDAWLDAIILGGLL